MRGGDQEGHDVPYIAESKKMRTDCFTEQTDLQTQNKLMVTSGEREGCIWSHYYT